MVLAKFKWLDACRSRVLTHRARTAECGDGAVDGVIDKALFLAEVLSVIPRRRGVAAMEDSAFFSANLCGGLSEHPRGTESTADAEGNVNHATKEAVRVLEGHRREVTGRSLFHDRKYALPISGEVELEWS
jgi:hypothetical protein